MSNLTDFETKKPEAMALTQKEIETPYMPVGIYLQEAEDLCKWAMHDLDKLLKAGLTEEAIRELPVLAGATREAQTDWMQEMDLREEAERLWKEQSPEAYDYRDQLIHASFYAFRDEPGMLTTVRRIDEGNGHADMIQDLNDLAALGRNNLELFTKVGYSVEDFDKAATLSDEMADLLARANGERFDANETKIMRDRMYTLLKRTVNDIRECGRFVFWRDEDRLKGYGSRYNRRTRN